MNNRKRKIGAYAIALAMLGVFGASAAVADSTTITVTWIVPGETGFSIAWAGTESEIVFDTGSENFTSIGARSQEPATPVINITNKGNTAVDYHMVFVAGFEAGITYVNCSAGDNTNTSLFSWDNSNETTSNHTVAESIAIDGYADFWFYSDGIEVLETAMVDDTVGLKITSVNV